jgi:subfamily B ATP-binding cassette protein MsbA
MDEAECLSGAEVYRRLLAYALSYWRYMILAITGMVVYAVSDPAFAALMKPLLDGSFVEHDPDIIAWAPLAIIVLVVLKGIGGFLSGYYMSYVGRLVVQQVRNDMFSHLLQLPVAYFDASSSGQLISRLTYNVEQIASAATGGLTTLVRDTLTLLGLVAWMLYLNWVLTIGFLVMAPFVAGFIAYITKAFRKISHKIQDSMGDVTHVAEEMIEGHRIVKIFGGQDYERRQFQTVNERNRRMSMRWVATKAAGTPFIQLILGLGLAGIVFLATHDSVLQQITVGTFVSFMIAIVMLLTPARHLTNVNSVLQQGIAAGQNIFQLLDSEREHDEAKTYHERCQGQIEFRDVQFSYEQDKGEVLKGISFTIQPGQTVALVGRSGSGKSTIANLLPRFYEFDAGQILLDGINIREYGLAELRKHLTYVSQEVILFNDTIANNIAYGRQGEVSREELKAVARAAYANEFIDALPQGLDTLVGENGVLLSGGQRQRLAIARALLKDAPILILDEATSALDTESERQIQAAMEGLLRNRTTLVIAHRLSTVENADRILVLQDGQIAERGTHAELMEIDGIYANLYRLQLKEPEIES